MRNNKKNALLIKGLVVRYGAVEALKGIDIEVKEGEIVALLGANGAGKTSTLRTISGLVEPTSGSIKLYDEEIAGRDAEKITVAGISQSPEGRAVFRDFTVEENLKIGAFTVKDKAQIQKNFEQIGRAHV